MIQLLSLLSLTNSIVIENENQGLFEENSCFFWIVLIL